MYALQTRQHNAGNVFTATIIILFILMLAGLSAALYWEKSQIVKTDTAERKKYISQINELKEARFKEQKEKEKNEEKIGELEKRYVTLEEQYKKLGKTHDEVVILTQLVQKQTEAILNTTTEGFKKVDEVARKIDMNAGRLSEVTSSIEKKSKLFEENALQKAQQKRAIELPTVVVKEKSEGGEKDRAATAQTLAPKTIQVMSVNEEYDFVVINKGLVDGLKVGEQYDVMRSSRLIATIKISEIRDFVSLGVIVSSQDGQQIQEGDTLYTQESK